MSFSMQHRARPEQGFSKGGAIYMRGVTELRATRECEINVASSLALPAC